jgi:hypothetical protein
LSQITQVAYDYTDPEEKVKRIREHVSKLGLLYNPKDYDE